jgi:hypothetical protein
MAAAELGARAANVPAPGLDESAEPNENVLREAFFRKFNKLDPNDQKKIEQMIDAWRKKS